MKPTSKLIIFIFTVLTLAASADAQSPREQLQQMVEQLQKTPTDNALREKIIKLVQTLKPAPSVPEEAREPFVMGATVLKKASDPAGASKAADLFTQALTVAPWFAEAYYNRALARETAGQFEPAIDDLKLYLEFKLTDAERREAQDKIYSLKADAQLASARKSEEVKAAAAKAAADTPQAREAALLQKVEGARFVLHEGTPYFRSSDIYEIRDRTLIITYRLHSWTGPITKYGYNRPGDYVIARVSYRDGAFTRTDSDFTYVYRMRPDGQALIAEGAFITNQPSAKGSDSVIPRE
jgi:tetratricopeptide (TPR) repeat protein